MKTLGTTRKPEPVDFWRVVSQISLLATNRYDFLADFFAQIVDVTPTKWRQNLRLASKADTWFDP